MSEDVKAPDRIWLLGLGGDEVTWSTDADPTGGFDGMEPDAIEYVRVQSIAAAETDVAP